MPSVESALGGTPFIPQQVHDLAAAQAAELAQQGRAFRGVQYRRLGLGLFAVILFMREFGPESGRERYCVLVYGSWAGKAELLTQTWTNRLDAAD